MTRTSTSDKPMDPATWQLLQERPHLFWDCDLPETPCRYFYPQRFWGWDHDDSNNNNNNNTSAPGSAFRDDYQRLGGTNKNLPAMVALSWYPTITTTSSTGDIHRAHPVVSLPILPHNLSFIHVHKCGGTTVKALLGQAKKKVVVVADPKTSTSSLNKATTKLVRADLDNYKYSFGGGSVAQKEYNQQRRQGHMDGMIRLQQQQNTGAVVFAVVRDPLERFVSAVQQVMHYHEDFRTACLKSTAQSTLQCAIRYLQEKGNSYLRDVHLVPMVTHFRLWDDRDVRIAVLHLNDIHVLAQYMTIAALGGNHHHYKNVNYTATTTLTPNMPHGRDRSNENYATSSVLSRMSVVEDCTPDMIRNLCQMYAVDVAFMASLGYTSRYCEP